MKPLVKTLCLAFLMSGFGSAGSQAGWIQNGVPLTQQWWGTVGGGVIVSDGSSGAIIVYQACRDGVGHLLVQHVDSMGVALWAQEGVDVCTDTSNQQHLQITSDGAGGAIITWEDFRAGNWDMYVQRVNASGTVLWMATGVPLCMAAGDQQYPAIVSDGAGGAIISWQDYRSGSNYDIYAQRVNASGVAQWTSNGVAVSKADGDQSIPQIASDGAGGGIISWQDYRNSNNYDTYAQRVNASGVVQWTSNGVAVCSAIGDQSNPQITSDGVGGAIISWQDYRNGSNYDIYAQRVNASGAAQWTSNGVPMCIAIGDQSHPTIISDAAGGAIVAWYDYRSGSSEICAQRVNASGAVQWTTNGILLGTVLGPLQNPAIITDGAGGMIATWNDNIAAIFPYIHATRVNASGAVQWKERVCQVMWGDLSVPAITSNGAGGAIVTWPAYGGSSDNKIYVQRMNVSGVRQLTLYGVGLSMAAGGQWKPASTSDGAGGAIITWEDWRSGNCDIYAQRMNASGVAQWTMGGVAIRMATGNQLAPKITSDGAGGAIITWEDLSGGDYKIYAQRVNASGAIQWTADGVRVSMAAGWQWYPAIISDGAGGAIITWLDNNSSTGRDIYAQRVNFSGAVEWAINGVPICTTTSDVDGPTIISDGVGGGIITWGDYRGGSTVYAQRVNASGAVQWTTNGVLLCTTGWKPSIVSDGASGAIVTWQDSRGGIFDTYDIYAQRVNAAGVVQWAVNGRPICTATGDQRLPISTADGGGGAIITWRDSRSGNYDIYAQRGNASGVVQWTTDGVPLCTAMGDQQAPSITADSAGGAIIAWHDQRSETADIYVQWVNASGAVLWKADGHELCTATGNQQNPAITSDGAGGAIVAWEDGRCGPMIYALRVFGEYAGNITTPRFAVTLDSNYPNPFNPRTVIRFYLPEAQEIVLDIYNVSGERVARLAEGLREKGYHDVTWDGRNSSGIVCSSGVYFSRLTAGKSSISRKMVIMR
jgi:predicted lipoprotein with Yx(FWY)xxD motif